MEMEHRNTINFLELTVRRGDEGGLTVTWYRKPTASLRYINYYSGHTISNKNNIIKMLEKRLQGFFGPFSVQRTARWRH